MFSARSVTVLNPFGLHVTCITVTQGRNKFQASGKHSCKTKETCHAIKATAYGWEAKGHGRHSGKDGGNGQRHQQQLLLPILMCLPLRVAVVGQAHGKCKHVNCRIRSHELIWLPTICTLTSERNSATSKGLFGNS